MIISRTCNISLFNSNTWRTFHRLFNVLLRSTDVVISTAFFLNKHIFLIQLTSLFIQPNSLHSSNSNVQATKSLHPIELALFNQVQMSQLQATSRFIKPTSRLQPNKSSSSYDQVNMRIACSHTILSNSYIVRIIEIGISLSESQYGSCSNTCGAPLYQSRLQLILGINNM